MGTIGERILEAIRHAPLDDDQLARRLGVSQRQAINQTARRLEAQGKLRRYSGPDGKIVNALLTGSTAPPPPAPPSLTPPRPISSGLLSEDEVKSAVKDHLEAEGFRVHIAWGRERGVDVDARHPDGRRWLVEAKGEVGIGSQQVNYFLGALAELVQRMADPAASYALALPDNRQYRSLVDRLPDLAKQRLGLRVFWVARGDEGLLVRMD